ncbi:hypothetical protein BE221DRAFT_143052 [Ostreococcus tauri]|uniref:Uncharacterized protein n=1 Tax=Ostreococcus tauri TaxID=70448 RepID=A0A1Y5HWQ0_OSTTA|nr:hypothetical protein BE221DRAFT_143052 [Ostreococcus tauri]
MTRIDTRLSHVLSQRRRPSEYAKVLVTACLALYFVRLCRRSRQDRIYGTTDSKTSHSVQNPVVACWILRTNSTSDLFRSQAIEASWGEFCYSIDFIDKQTPGIIADWFEVYEDLSAKSYRAWNFMYRKYLSPDSKQVPLVDFILKADVDTYIIGHNMLEYVAHFDPDKPYYIGKNFIDLNGQHFVAGTAIILSRAALRILAHASSAHCSFEAFREKQAEDLALAICLQDLNIRPYDTRDSSGAERFMVFGPDMMRLGGADGRPLGNLCDW